MIHLCVKINPDCVETYNNLKLGRKYQAIFYKLNDDNSLIVTDKTLPPGSTFAQFAKEIPENECRYVVFDYEYKDKADGNTKNKIVFLSWCPDTASIKKKMVATSSKDSIRKALVGIQVDIQGTDASEITEEEFYNKANKL
eukprot:gene5402-6738_t